MNHTDHEEIIRELEELYHDEGCGLDFENSYQALIATILSAQTTDRQVNKITPALFARFPSPQDIAQRTPEEIELYIKSVGVYKNKARNIVLCCQKLIQDFDGIVPDTMEGLISLPGVGRKTANVVLSNCFGKPAIAVDTHVFRVSNRLGLAHADTVDKTEQQLRDNIPEDLWSSAHHWLIWHGRRVCTARKPACEECSLRSLCNYYRTQHQLQRQKT